MVHRISKNRNIVRCSLLFFIFITLSIPTALGETALLQENQTWELTSDTLFITDFSSRLSETAYRPSGYALHLKEIDVINETVRFILTRDVSKDESFVGTEKIIIVDEVTVDDFILVNGSIHTYTVWNTDPSIQKPIFYFKLDKIISKNNVDFAQIDAFIIRDLSVPIERISTISDRIGPWSEPSHSMSLLWRNKHSNAASYSKVSISSKGDWIVYADVSSSNRIKYLSFLHMDGTEYKKHEMNGKITDISIANNYLLVGFIKKSSTYDAYSEETSTAYLLLYDKTGKLMWEKKLLIDGEEVETIPHVSISSDGTLIAAAVDNSLCLLDKTGTVIKVIYLDDSIRDVSVSANKEYIGVSFGNNIYLYDRYGYVISNLKTNSDEILIRLSVSDDGNVLAMTQNTLYYFSKNGIIWEKTPPSNSFFYSLSLSNNGEFAAVTTSNGLVSIINEDGNVYASMVYNNEVFQKSYIYVSIPNAANYVVTTFLADSYLYEVTPILSSTVNTGNLSIVSNPSGAKIYIDGDYKGITPQTISEIPSGDHTILLEKSGFKNLTDTVNIVAGKVVSKSPALVEIKTTQNSNVIADNLDVVDTAITNQDPILEDANDPWKQLTSQPLLIIGSIIGAIFGVGLYYYPRSKNKKRNVSETHVSNPVAKDGNYPTSVMSSTFPLELQSKYTDINYIDKGGFARVFKAVRKDNVTVALKIPISFDETTGKTFLKEIKAWEELKHPNIIGLYDMNIMPVPYFEMEYANNMTVNDLEKPLDVELATKLVFDISEGVGYAHSKGIVHRDLKPCNVLLTNSMVPKISDWGLSKVIAESKSSSNVGFTPIYAAPEQISPKKFGRPDHRTDIYQIGVIFYELVTGKLPFGGEDFSEIGFAIINDNPEPPSVLNSECAELDSIILKCLNKHPDDRYQIIAEFQQDLAGYLKVEYKNSLAKSVGDLKRSCVYCGDLVLIHAKINDVEGALKYALDMKNYAGDVWSNDVEDIVKKLDYLSERKQPINDELMTKINVVLHQLKMGR